MRVQAFNQKIWWNETASKTQRVRMQAVFSWPRTRRNEHRNEQWVLYKTGNFMTSWATVIKKFTPWVCMNGNEVPCSPRHVYPVSTVSFVSERDLYATTRNVSEQKVKPQRAEGRVFVTYGGANPVKEETGSVRQEQGGGGSQALLLLGKHSQHSRAQPYYSYRSCNAVHLS